MWQTCDEAYWPNNITRPKGAPCGRRFNDEFHLTYCPHEDFTAQKAIVREVLEASVISYGPDPTGLGSITWASGHPCMAFIFSNDPKKASRLCHKTDDVKPMAYKGTRACCGDHAKLISKQEQRKESEHDAVQGS